MSEIEIQKIVENLIDTFLYAGKISIKLREKGLVKKIKSDNTPVTNGDLEVNKILTDKIIELTPTLPIISEETSDNRSINDLNNFWLIDPIDGTFDYLNNLDEFTINAGLILNKKPAAGLIYAPAKKRMFYSFGENSAYELIDRNPSEVPSVLIDKKIPSHLRDKLPVIVSGTDEILWVPGLPPAEKAKLFESSDRVIRLTYTHSPT